MDTIILSILIVVISVLSFLILRPIVLLLLRALLNGPLNAIYLDYLRLSTKLKIDEAFATLNSDRAWSELVFSKVYEIGSNRVSYAKREQNLKYIKEAAVPSRKLVDELIKVLPKQYRKTEFQAKLACYICELANKVKSSNGNNKPDATINKTIIETLSLAFSLWGVGFIGFVFCLKYVFEQYPPFLLLFVSLSFVLIMNIPTIQLIRHGLTGFSTVASVVALTLALLGGFAVARVDRIHRSDIIQLDAYKNPGAAMSIEYAEWITLSNRDCKGVKLSVYHYGQLSTPIEFRMSDDRFSFIDKNCGGIIPRMEISQSENQAYEFYVLVQDNSVINSGLDSVSLIPQYVDASGKLDFAEQDRVHLQLENWFWNASRNLSLQIFSVGSTLAWVLFNSWARKKN